MPTKCRGLCWIWTKLDLEDLAGIETKEGTKGVPISKLAETQSHLKYRCRLRCSGYTIIYNGMGGYKKSTPRFGLRERINQELNCSIKRTGTLNLLNRKGLRGNIKKENWAISFFDFDDERNNSILQYLKPNSNIYLDHSENLEANWRIEYGTPLLTRR